jgi:hypothetical protein
MLKQKLNSHGFHAIGALMAVCIAVVIAFVGLRIFKLQSHSTAEGQSAVPAASLSAPAGWKLYVDKSVGVQFVYPDVYGSFQEPTDVCCGLTKADFPEYESVLVTNRASKSYLPGVAGYFSLGSYRSGDAEIRSRNFGPRIRLAGDEWKVTVPGDSNPENYKSGDTYPEVSRTNARGLNVFTATVITEGVTNYRLYFVTKDKLRELRLPPFDSERDSSTYNINDQAPYDTMYQQIRDSVSLY